MPFWIKCILMFWIVTLMESIVLNVYSDEVRKILFIAKVSHYRKGTFPWYLTIYAINVVISFLLILPFFVWFIFLR